MRCSETHSPNTQPGTKRQVAATDNISDCSDFIENPKSERSEAPGNCPDAQGAEAAK